MGTRTLSDIELTEVKLVFHEGLDTSRVRISENSWFTNALGRIGAVYRHTPTPQLNAATIGNTSYFPIQLDSSDPTHPNWLNHVGWLMHELTHQWQYQHVGIRYLFEAIRAPTYTYAAQGKSPNLALTDFSQMGKNFNDFNREQQGDIVRDYYFALKQNQTVSGWDSYLKDVRLSGRPHP